MVILFTREGRRIGKFNPFIAFDFLVFLVFSPKLKLQFFSASEREIERQVREIDKKSLIISVCVHLQKTQPQKPISSLK